MGKHKEVIEILVRKADEIEDRITLKTNKPFEKAQSAFSKTLKLYRNSYNRFLENKRFLRNFLFFFWPLAYYLISLWFTSLAGNYATQKDGLASQPPLSDLVHENIPPVPIIVVDILFWVIFVVAIVYVFIFQREPARSFIIRRYLFFMGTLYYLRVLAVVLTRLPNSIPCSVSPDFNVWTRISWEQCGDMMFSGHTAHGLTLTLIIQSYAKNKLFKVVMWLITVPYIFLVAVSRLHYTIDVLIAVYVTATLWVVFQRVWPIKSLPHPEPASPHSVNPSAMTSTTSETGDKSLPPSDKMASPNNNTKNTLHTEPSIPLPTPPPSLMNSPAASHHTPAFDGDTTTTVTPENRKLEKLPRVSPVTEEIVVVEPVPPVNTHIITSHHNPEAFGITQIHMPEDERTSVELMPQSTG